MPADPAPFSALEWRKSRASADSGNCVEVAIRGASVLVRDSRGQPDGVLEVTSGRWREFVGGIRDGRAGLTT
jgi:Domain of unknown function (DUF397)